MKVFSFTSEDGKITISADTAADMAGSWRRFAARTGEQASTYCDYRSTLPGSLQLSLPSANFSLQNVGDAKAAEWKRLPPVFYETATYNLSIYFKDLDSAPSVLHKLKEVSDLFTAINVGEGKWLLSAPMSFLNEPGIFELAFRYKPIGAAERSASFSFRVVSPKLDTKADFNHLLAEVNAQYNDIIYQYLTLTMQSLQRGGRSDNVLVWLSIFRSIARDYEKWVRYIVHKPHLRQSREVRHDRAERIKRWSPGMEEKYAESQKESRLEKDYFRHEEIIHTHNTRENRFVKFTIERIGKRLATIVDEIKRRNAMAPAKDKVAESELAELDGYVASLRRLANSSLLRKLRGEPLRSESMVLQKRTGYAQVYKSWLLLQKGIEFFEGSNAIGVRPIWELYELWCFLKMRKMIADILGLDFGNPKEIEESPMPMVEPFEDNSKEHIIYYHCSDKSVVRLHYQHTYSRRTGEAHTATTENRPDIVLTIRKPDGFELTYLFDAKYRLLDDSRLNREDVDAINEAQGADTPPSDAINQMHRYRDAIYYGSGSHRHTSKEVIGGYILFPGRGDNESVRKRYFYQSIKDINIGAFPLLPDAKDPDNEGSLLYEFLAGILTAPQAFDHIKDSIPQKGLRYLSSEKQVDEDLVLVGYYKDEEHLRIIKRTKIYYVRTGSGHGTITLVSGVERTKYLLLHHKGHRELLRLKGEGPKFYTRQALEKLGFTPKGDFHLAFEIDANQTPVEGLDPYACKIEGVGNSVAVPYFTTVGNLKC